MYFQIIFIWFALFTILFFVPFLHNIAQLPSTIFILRFLSSKHTLLWRYYTTLKMKPIKISVKSNLWMVYLLHELWSIYWVLFNTLVRVENLSMLTCQSYCLIHQGAWLSFALKFIELITYTVLDKISV